MTKEVATDDQPCDHANEHLRQQVLRTCRRPTQPGDGQSSSAEDVARSPMESADR